jgi:hypothetical protein
VTGRDAVELVVREHALYPADERRLLYMLGLLPTPGRRQERSATVRPRIRPHARHTRGSYQPGCPACREVNARYAQRWRAGRAVTSRVAFGVLEQPAGRGHGRAFVGQVFLEVS